VPDNPGVAVVVFHPIGLTPTVLRLEPKERGGRMTPARCHSKQGNGYLGVRNFPTVVKLVAIMAAQCTFGDSNHFRNDGLPGASTRKDGNYST